MNDNIKPNEISQRIEEIQKEIPNLNVPTMGIISEKNNITINNNEFIKTKEIKEDKDVK